MEWSRRLDTRIRTIWALVVRDTQMLREGKRLGYFEVYWNPLLLLACFMVLRTAIRGQFSAESLEPEMLVPGFALFFIFRDLLGKGIGLGRPVSHVFHFPRITVLDYFTAHAIISWTIYIILLVVVLGFFAAFGWSFDLTQWIWLVAGVAFIFWFSLGSTLVVWSLMVRFPWLGLFLGILNRMLFWVSGVFFAPTSMPANMQVIIAWNPISQCLQMARAGLGVPTPPVFLNYTYVMICTVSLLVLGLLLALHAEKVYRK